LGGHDRSPRGDELEHEIHTLIEAPGKDIVLTGSITLAHDVLGKGLVDDLRLFLYQVILGQGRRLLPEGWSAPRLQLIEEVLVRDVMVMRYGIDSGHR